MAVYCGRIINVAILDYLILFILLALVAEILGTIGGFGSSLFFVPIASFFLDFESVLGVTALFHLSSNITKLTFFRKGIDKNLFLYLGIPSVVFVVAGAYLSQYINTFYLEICLAFFLIVISVLFLAKPDLKLKIRPQNTILGGAISGFSAGLIGTGGAIRGLTLSSFSLRPEVFIATSALIDLCVDSSRSVVYFANGFIHKHDLYLLPLLLISSVLGTWIGKKILDRLSFSKFRTIVLFLITATGVITLIKLLI